MRTPKTIVFGLLIVLFGIQSNSYAQDSEDVHRYFNIGISPGLNVIQENNDELRDEIKSESTSNVTAANATVFPLFSFGIGYEYLQNNPLSSDDDFEGSLRIDYNLIKATYRFNISRCTIMNPENIACQVQISFGTGQAKYEFDSKDNAVAEDFESNGSAQLFGLSLNWISPWAFNFGARLGYIHLTTSCEKAESIAGEALEIHGNFSGLLLDLNWGF